MRHFRVVGQFLALAMLAGCELLAARPEDPAMARLAELERRMSALERVIDNGTLVELSTQVAALERRTDALQGRTETIEYDAEETAERQRQLYADLDARLQDIESNVTARRGVSVLEGGRLPPGQLPVPEGTDRDNYQAAFELLKQERYAAAATAFEQFLVSFPESQLADNAQYWLAESRYAADKFEQALRDFSVVIEKYPRSRKVPDALLKIGYCNYNLKRWDQARTALSRVQAEYPETTAARLAAQYLKRMQSEGV